MGVRGLHLVGPAHLLARTHRLRAKEAIKSASGSTSPTGIDGCTQDFRASSRAREGYDVITFTSSGDWVFPDSPASQPMTGRQEIKIVMLPLHLDSRENFSLRNRLHR